MQGAEEEASSAMADLATAAAQMDAEADEMINDAGEAARKRRKRGTKLEVAERKVSEAQAQLKIFQDKYSAFIAAGRKPTEKPLLNLETKIASQKDSIVSLEKNLAAARQENILLQQRADAAAKRKAEKAEMENHLSDNAL